MKTFADYKAALIERDEHDLHSTEWDICQHKVNCIVAVLMEQGNTDMVRELVDEVYSLNDCGMMLESVAVQVDLWLLESNGHKDKADELKQLDWE